MKILDKYGIEKDLLIKAIFRTLITFVFIAIIIFGGIYYPKLVVFFLIGMFFITIFISVVITFYAQFHAEKYGYSYKFGHKRYVEKSDK